MLILPLLFSAGIQAQEKSTTRTLLEVPADTIYISTTAISDTLPYRLPHQFIIPQSEKLHIRSFRLLENIHYRIDYLRGELFLEKDLPQTDSLRVIYRRHPFPLISNYFHRELKPYSPDDTSAGDIAAREVRPKFLDEIDSYQSNLKKNGSIVRGIEIGSNQDLTLNSGLNLQLSGQIAPGVDLVAALTDESTPIQPEGNTQTLREVDKVFVKINSPYVGGTLGDFNLEYRNSLFGNLQRKLQGITVENQFKNTRQQVTYGTSRGFFHSNRFLAQEGNQGPYLLTGRNGEREIIALAGTEKVYVDGVQQVRGKNNDYIIDYGLAQITFTNNKLITSENRIEVDFEYTNSFQRYGRTFVGASSQGKNKNGRISYDLRLFRELDDTNNLLEDNSELTPEEQAVLENAGDDPLAATLNGAVFVGRDSTGMLLGNYNLAIDTLAGGELQPFFIFAGPNLGEYRVAFSGVGSGNGDYRRLSLGRYEYVGKGNGIYLPVRLVPLAGTKQFADLDIGLFLTKNWKINAEMAVSDFDQNVFSSLDDGNNQGNAMQFGSTLADSSLRIAGLPLGRVQLSGNWRRQEDAFSPLDRPLQPEYAYKWNLGQENLTNQEESYEADLEYQPWRFIRFNGNLGSVTKGSDVSSDRRSIEINLRRKHLPQSGFRVEQVSSSNLLSSSDWLRRRVTVLQRWQHLIPSYEFRQEDRTVESRLDGRLSGFAFDNHQAGIELPNRLGIDWNAALQYRSDQLYDPRNPGDRIDQATTQTYEFKARLKENQRLQGSFSLAFRDKNFSDFFERLPDDSLPVYQPDAQFQDTTWQDRQSHLANLELQYRNKERTLTARWDYKVSSELQALREKVYFRVGDNLGNFLFDSTLNEYVPDPQGDFILIQLQTGSFESVTNLETAWQLQYKPKAPEKSDRGWTRFFKNLSSFSYARITEQSREDDILNIYFLRINTFHNVNSSLKGNYTINQDLHYNERNPLWGILLRSRYRDNLSNQFLDESNNESRIIWERILQLRRRLFNRKLNVIGEYRNAFNKRWVASAPSRNLNIATQIFSGRFNYRPSIRWQIQLEAEQGFDNDRNTLNPLRVNYLQLKPQVAYALRGKARTTADLTYLQVNETENPGARALPFEMAKGKKAGNSWLWNLRFEYFINTNVTVNANYTGRRDANAIRTLHLGKAEVRAFF